MHLFLFSLILILLLPLTTVSSSPTSRQDSPLLTSWSPPLTTRGRYIVDATGSRFRLKAGNWHGASGTYEGKGDYDDPSKHHAGEQAYQTVICLDRVHIDTIVQGFIELGINSIRLPFSNAMIHSKRIVPDHALTANPQLRNMTPLQIYDETIKALTKRGIAVILNNHTVKDEWCCGLDWNARWNLLQTEAEWIRDWVFMVERYRHDSRVVGADLFNEVRRDLFRDATWGGGTDVDWYTASMRAAVAIQRSLNPHVLIIVEGINWSGIPANGLAHWRPELQPLATLSHALPLPEKLVYNAHFYGFTSPSIAPEDSALRNSSTSTSSFPGIPLADDPTYRDLPFQQLKDLFHVLAGFIPTPLNQTQSHYTTPLWISEFGTQGRSNLNRLDRRWWKHMITILDEGDLEFAIWPLLGWHEDGQGDLWALQSYDSKGRRLSIQDPGDWRKEDWDRLMRGEKERRGFVEKDGVDTWRMLATDWESQQQSNLLDSLASRSQPSLREPREDLQALPVLPPQMFYASCPDGMRMQGMSHSLVERRALCTDAVYGGSLWTPSEEQLVVLSSPRRNLTWSQGRGAFQCPPNHFLIGYTYTQDLSVDMRGVEAREKNVLRLTPKEVYCASLHNNHNTQFHLKTSDQVVDGEKERRATSSSNRKQERNQVVFSAAGRKSSNRPSSSSTTTTKSHRTIWFLLSSSPGSERHGRFTSAGVPTGVCGDAEVAVGYAFDHLGRPAALLCQAGLEGKVL